MLGDDDSGRRRGYIGRGHRDRGRRGANLGKPGAGGGTRPDGAAIEVGAPRIVVRNGLILRGHLGDGLGVEPDPVEDRKAKSPYQEYQEEEERLGALRAG